MSRFTQARRWVTEHIRGKRGQIAEFSITPDEARTAVLAIMIDCGLILERLWEYDPNCDEFRTEARHHETNKLHDCRIPGEVVAHVVVAARQLAGRGKRPLVRPHEREQERKQNAMP